MKKYYLLLTCILLIALAIRCYGISAVTNVDEPNIVNRAVQFADGQWRIPWYNWPAQSLMRIDGAVFKAYSVVKQQPVKILYQAHRNTFFVLARLITILFSLIAIVFLYLIGKALNSETTGLLAALFLSVSYLFTINSRFVTPDVPMTTMFLVVLYASFRLLKAPTVKWCIIAGVAIGFAVATKYTGALAILPIVMVYILNIKKVKQSVFSVFISALSVILTAFIIHTIFNPFAIIDYKLVLHDVLFEAKPNRLGADWSGETFPFLRNLWLYLSESLKWNGTLISLIGYATMIFVIIKDHKHWREHLLLLSFFFVTLVGLSILGLHWSRWAVPLTPFMALYAAYGVEYIWSIVGTRYIAFPRMGLMILILIIPQILLGIFSGYSAIHDTRTITLMSEYIKANVSAGSVIVADTYYLDIGKQFQLNAPKRKLYNKTMVDYKSSGVEYLVVKPKRLVAAQKQPDKYNNVITFFNDLQTSATKAYTVQAQPASLTVPSYDYQVYWWLLTKFVRGEKLTTIKGTELVLYRL
ncbi:MAG: glycosyltransferase family 39 protein [Patescibacteria group bacterium]|jgi:4-amino-4-deoxy-L-arabinose transferase-like glycosyltransferase